MNQPAQLSPQNNVAQSHPWRSLLFIVFVGIVGLMGWLLWQDEPVRNRVVGQ